VDRPQPVTVAPNEARSGAGCTEGGQDEADVPDLPAYRVTVLQALSCVLKDWTNWTNWKDRASSASQFFQSFQFFQSVRHIRRV
jgi:hypothetical protein